LVECYENCTRCKGPEYNNCTDCLTGFNLTLDHTCIYGNSNIIDTNNTHNNTNPPNNSTKNDTNSNNTNSADEKQIQAIREYSTINNCIIGGLITASFFPNMNIRIFYRVLYSHNRIYCNFIRSYAIIKSLFPHRN